MGHQFSHLDFLTGPVADHGRGRLEQALESRVALLCPILLDKTQDSVDHDDGHDDGKIAVLTHHQRNCCRRENDIYQRVLELGEKDRPG